MTLSVEHLNAVLVGFTEVIELKLQTDRASQEYDLQLVLADGRGDTIVLNCSGISNFRMSEFGGGLTQFLALRAEDVRSQQLDRIVFHFTDLERGTIDFTCSAADVNARKRDG
jgi:hypothetical protein